MPWLLQGASPPGGTQPVGESHPSAEQPPSLKACGSPGQGQLMQQNTRASQGVGFGYNWQKI